MRIKAGNTLSSDAGVIDFGASATVTETNGHAVVGGLGGIVSPLTADIDAGGHTITGLGDVVVTGLTGATAGARLAGGTPSGAPLTGTFAVGDLVVSRGDGKLYVCTTAGSPGTFTQVGSGAGFPSGSSMPGSPATNDVFYRTDLKLLFTFDGTRWVTVTQYRVPFFGPLFVVSTIAPTGYLTMPNGSDIYLEKFLATVTILTTNDGSNFWTATFSKTDPALSATSLGTITTAADTVATWTQHSLTVNAQIAPASFPIIQGALSKTGTPGNLFMSCDALYRIVGT